MWNSGPQGFTLPTTFLLFNLPLLTTRGNYILLSILWKQLSLTFVRIKKLGGIFVLHAICLHLREEHCFDLKNAVCPICASNLGKDAIGHFTTQHSHSVKRRRKSQKSGLWNNSSMVLGKDMRDVNSYLGPDSMNGRGNMHENAPDPLLSPFLCCIPLSDPKSNRDAEITCDAASVTSEAIRTKSDVPDEAQEQDNNERRQRAAFAQQLTLSTIF